MKDIRKKVEKILDDLTFRKDKNGYYYLVNFVDYLFTKLGKSEFKNLATIKITNLMRMYARELSEIEGRKITNEQLERNFRYLYKDKTENIQEYFRYYEKITTKVVIILIITKVLEGDDNN